MLVTGALGFSSLVLVACLLVPVVIGFVCRRKWRQGQARQEEIRRLLVLAAEEAARAEYEASATYAPVPAAPSYQCAVCYSPTTTRCARCKAVRYCSGKCQIVHWRQGHREECHPAPIANWTTDAGKNYGCKETEQDESLISSEGNGTEDRQLQKPVETLSTEPVLFNSSCCPEIPSENDDDDDDDIKVEFLSHGKGSNSTSESSGSIFSGFSTSCSGSDSSDDVSVSESISSLDPEKPDGQMSSETAVDVENTDSADNLDKTKPLSPKFSSLVDSVNKFTSSSKFNQTKSDCSNSKAKHASTNSSGLSSSGMVKGSVAEPCTSSSGFWERALNSGSEDDADVESCLSNSTGAGDNNMLDSNSVLKFSFKLSGSTISPSGAHGEGLESNDALPDSLGISVPIDGTSFSEKINANTANVRDSSSLKCGRSSEKDGNTGSFASKSVKVQSLSSSSSIRHSSFDDGGRSSNADARHVTSLPSSSSQRPNHVANAMGKTSVSSKSSGSDVQSSSTGGNTVLSGKSGKTDSNHASAAVSSEAASYLPNAKNGLKTSMWKVVDQFRGSKPKHNLFTVGSEIAGRYNDKGLFPYDTFVKLYNWNKVELLPCGLVNCGNSCYANAVLQCLTFTPPLTAYFLQGLHSKACAKKEWCFTCEFESLILKAKEGNSPLSPIRILSQLQNIGSQLGHGREEDAHEFLRYAVDTMQSVCLKEAGAKPGSPDEETTLIGLTFGGYLRSKIQCTKCLGKSERQERMMDLTVEIEGDIGTLEEALRQFTGTEILDGENKYYCSRCKSYEKAKKKLTVLEAPNVLTIALKRFQSGKFGKLNKSIRFPEILDLAPYMTGTSDKSPIYRLCGVVVHLDIMNSAFSGHYVCYVKNIQNKWFKIDDSTVTAVELERVLTKGAYMLLYSRCSPRAPRSIKNRIVTPDPKVKAAPPKNSGKITASKSRVATADPTFVQLPSPVSLDGSASYDSFYTNFNRLQKILEVDSSSDNSSLISSNSDVGSCSTESTRDSTSTDDFSDYIFGDLGYGGGWNSPWRNSSDSDTSSSSPSPLYSRHYSPLADTERYGCSTEYASFEGKRSVPFLDTDSTTKQYKKIGSSSSSSSSFRETDSEKLGGRVVYNSLDDEYCRKWTRTD